MTDDIPKNWSLVLPTSNSQAAGPIVPENLRFVLNSIFREALMRTPHPLIAADSHSIPPSYASITYPNDLTATGALIDSNSECTLSGPSRGYSTRSPSPPKGISTPTPISKHKRRSMSVESTKRFIIGSRRSTLAAGPSSSKSSCVSFESKDRTPSRELQMKGKFKEASPSKIPLFEKSDDEDDKASRALTPAFPEDESVIDDGDNGTDDRTNNSIIHTAKDFVVFRRAFVIGLQKFWDDISAGMAYLNSRPLQAGREDNDERLKVLKYVATRAANRVTTGIKLRTQPTRHGRWKTDFDIRKIIREHFKTLMFPDSKQASVPWKNIGVWLFVQEKRFIRWDANLPTNFSVNCSDTLFSFLKKDLHWFKVLAVELEDWSEDEKTKKYNSEIPLVVDPQNQVLCKVEDLCGMYPDRFVKARGNMLPGMKSEIDSEYSYSGPWIITYVGSS